MDYPIQKNRTTKLLEAMKYVENVLPIYYGLLNSLTIVFNSFMPTACVFPKRIFVFNPVFFTKLTTRGLAFVLCHEMMHLVYKTSEISHEFSKPYLVKVAHDFQINQFLSDLFSEKLAEEAIRPDVPEDLKSGFEDGFIRFLPPAGGLYWHHFLEDLGPETARHLPVDICTVPLRPLVSLLERVEVRNGKPFLSRNFLAARTRQTICHCGY